MGCGSSSNQDSLGPPEAANNGLPIEEPNRDKPKPPDPYQTPNESPNTNIKSHDKNPPGPPEAVNTPSPIDKPNKDNASSPDPVIPPHTPNKSPSTDIKPPEKVPAPPAKTQGENKCWREILKEVSMDDLWPDTKRKERPLWKDKLEESLTLARSPKRKIPEELVSKVLHGETSTSVDQQLLKAQKSKVTIFISSTFTDTRAERNLLIRDVYPYLRNLCGNLGLDFGTVDMRWGVKEEMAMEHETTAMCLAEVERCTRESAGPAVLSIIGHKYGYRTLPVSIAKAEFEKLIELLKSEKQDFSVVDNFYQMDTNAIPVVYVLKPRSSDDNEWWNREKQVIKCFRAVAMKLGPEESEKYFISITEQELKVGFLDNPLHSEQVLSLKRELEGIEEAKHLHRHMVDMTGGVVDNDAQEYLKQLKDQKIPQITAQEDVVLEFKYFEDDPTVCRKYVQDLCDSVCAKLVHKIMTSYKTNLHVERDPVFDEVLQHQMFAEQKSKVFVGRDPLLNQILHTIKEGHTDEKQVLSVYGRSGCGKTSLMAVVAKQIKEKVFPNSALVLRFLGTTSGSGSARSVLQSVCTQIARVYNQDIHAVPSGYGDLIEYFLRALAFATKEKPLVVILDSLDQLSNEDFGQNLKWLSLREKIPPHAHVIVSTIPGGCLTTLKAYIPDNNLIEVLDLSTSDAPLVLEKMLEAHNRTVTPEQKHILLNAVAKCPLPLYLRLAVDIALKWHSYDTIGGDAIAPDMPGLINTLFERLESKFGLVFVQHALAYITCARDGLSVTELEDVLSCDDDVLDELFDFWLPPFRRIPQLLWIRVRNELGMYLMERGTDGVNAYGWYHRQFWETAQTRYTAKEGKWGLMNAHEALANYFDGIWSGGKLWTPTRITRAITDLTPKMEDRQVPPQPIVLSGQRDLGRQLNRRKLSELPYHLSKLEDWKRMEEKVADLEFIEAKFEAGQGYDCQSLFLQAAQKASSIKLASFSKFIGLGLAHFLHESVGVYQLAAQQVQGTPVRVAFEDFDPSKLPRKITRSLVEETTEDPCEMTLRGHTGGVRCVRFNPMGHLVASTSEDASMRIWDVFSGAEIVTVTGLPGPRYAGLADPYHGERPCVWDKKGQHVITGSEDGGVQVWDINGAQIQDKTPHSGAVTGVDVSNDNAYLATASKDGTLKVWKLADFSLVASVNVGQCLACVFSPDGTRLAVSLYGSVGLAIIDCSSWSILSTGNGMANLNICVDWSPRGTEIVTGGDNSAITVWNPSSGQVANQLVSHRAWIWCVTYNADGTRLISCSSDRSMKLWDMNTGNCIVSLGGHGHRVTWASFRPGTNDKFVSSSLDLNIKVWDNKAVSMGRVPKKGGLGYIILKASPCGRYHATCQGWNKCCTIYDSKTEAVLGESPTHQGFISDACYTPDSQYFITVDTGHTGAYENADVVRNAKVKVCCDGGDTELDVSAPSAIATNKQYIAVGNIDGEISLFRISDMGKERSWSITSASTPKIYTISCSQSDSVIAVGTKEAITLWDIRDGSLITTLPATDSMLDTLLFSPSGDELLLGTRSGKIYIYTAKDRAFKETKTIHKHTSHLADMVFSHGDGELFATTSADLSTRIWNVKKGYSAHSVYYGPVIKMGFRDKDTIIFGESTGNKIFAKFEL